MAKGDESLGIVCSHGAVSSYSATDFLRKDVYRWEAAAMREQRRREGAEARIECLEEEREEVKALALGVGDWGAFSG